MSKKKDSGAKIELNQLYQLDWIKILNRAIKNRPTSWHDPAVREWRNASDEILFSLMQELKENNPPYWQKIPKKYSPTE